MKLGGISLFRIGGIEIVMDYSWLAIYFLVVYSMRFLPQASAQQAWIFGSVTALLFFISVLLHELAHSFVAMRHGIRITSIRLVIFGGLPQGTSEPKTGRDEFLIALAGPATSMALAMLFLMIYSYSLLTRTVTPVTGIAGWLAMANVLVAVINLIPGFPLDGGRLLRAFLWDHWGDMGRATKVVSQVGNGFSLFMILFGILQLLLGQNPVLGVCFVFLGLFMKRSATGSYQAVMLRRVLSGTPVRQIMTENIVSVDWLISIDELIKYIYKHQFTTFPVFNRDEFVGMVSLDEVKKVSRDLWIFKQVRDVMTPVEMVPCLRPTDDATDALAQMVTVDAGPMPVVEDGRLLGILSRRDIMNFFRIKSDLGAV